MIWLSGGVKKKGCRSFREMRGVAVGRLIQKRMGYKDEGKERWVAEVGENSRP